MLVCSNGKKVAPRRLEEILSRFAWIDQICLIGDNRPFIGALLVVNLEGLNSRFTESGVAFASLEEAVLREKVWQLTIDDIAIVNKGTC